MVEGKHIAIVDDDPGIQEALQLIFKRAGYKVSMYSSAESFLSNKFEVPDLFLLDKQLSGTDGLDLCKYLRQQKETKDIPIIMISASPSIANAAKQAGADDFIEKPFSMQALLKMIKEYI